MRRNLAETWRGARRAGKFVLSRSRRDDVLHEWRRSRGEAPVLPARIHAVMVVCHGNICRSPFAEHTLRRLRPDLEIVSSGLCAGGGDPADPTAVRAAQRFGVDLRGHSSRPLSGEGVARADLILAMEGHHVGQIARRWPEARRRTLMLGAFLTAAPYTLEDPWGEPDEVFAGVFRRIDDASRRLVAQLASSEV